MSVPVEGGPQCLEPSCRLGPQTHWQNQPLAKKGRNMCLCIHVCMHASEIWGS